jgi:hypothetical protein
MCDRGRRRIFLACIAMSAIVTVAVGIRLWRGSRVFRRYVCAPIPRSVKGIRVHRPFELDGHRYILRFHVSKADMKLILSKRDFREVTDVEYEYGNLHWRLDATHGESLHLCSSRRYRTGPSWFWPNDWPGAKAYRFKEMSVGYRPHFQIIIYNEELAEAYCVEYQAGD